MTLTSITAYELEFGRQYDPIARALASMEADSGIYSPQQGYFIGPLNTDMLVSGSRVGPEYGLAIEGIGSYPSSYYVDDSPEDFIRKYHDLLEADERIFAVFFTLFAREDQSSSGGWRWHKWGEYIGEKTPTTEYLYDEPKIERIYVVHIAQVRR